MVKAAPKSAGGKSPRKPFSTKPKSSGGMTPRKPLASKPKSTGGEVSATNEINIIFKVAHAFAYQKYDSTIKPLYSSPRDSDTLAVDPTMKIADLKLLLRYKLCVPFYENFMLAKQCSRQRYNVYHDSSTLGEYGVKDQEEVVVLMEGYSLDPDWYRRFLYECGDNQYPLGEPVESVSPMEESEIQLEKVKIYFNLAHTLKPLDPANTLTPKQVSSRNSVHLMVHPKMPIGILKIMLRSRFWIPFSENFDLAHLHGPVIGDDDRSTLSDYAVKEEDTILLLMESIPLDRSLLFQQGTVHFSSEEPKKLQIFIKSAHYLRQYWRYPERSEDNRHKVRLTVEPTMTIGSLKSMLKTYYWIPMKNLVIFAEPISSNNAGSSTSKSAVTIFDDDSFTLDMCHIKDGDTLMTCMEDGRFRMRVYDYTTLRVFPITVSSCFETIHDLKMKIRKTERHRLEDQILTRPGDYVPLDDGTLLVTLGIIKPFMKLMEKSSANLKLRVRKPIKEGFCS